MDIISGVRVLINGGAQRATSATGVAVVMQQLKPGVMLRTTHERKACFVAIDVNTQFAR